jgi:hypothetical protein
LAPRNQLQRFSGVGFFRRFKSKSDEADRYGEMAEWSKAHAC